MNEINFLVKKFSLAPHPEGGYFKETYRSTDKIKQQALSENYNGDRNHSTCIYYLLTSDTFSAFHKINQDEVWHFYSGSPLKLHVITDAGEYYEHIIGNNFSEGEIPQFVVPGGYWFAAKTTNPYSYSFVGCTVSPGFDFEDFVLPKRKELVTKFPEHEEIITQLTRI
ncbi:cupin domain-containing protein [Flagellimonas pacifica]|uniref:DUF985 domain-containing protein n=1 Tax=Flagellimonas pacifica TaxID=1247520 RepID=A0A285MY55_9FLAO|nr:cupin domain-containing protein [Allomuricauda parva]SNZ02018.1 hypothetical protein SAMN06265377_3875 [Allomuricauda parva]